MGNGTAVLVHGAWSKPDDWRWVARLVEDAGVVAVAPDLPSHRVPFAAIEEDVEIIEVAIRHAEPPVVVVGWSYGGAVLSGLSAALPLVHRLVYVASVPQPVDEECGRQRAAGSPDLAHLLFPDDRTVVLDDEWWLTEGSGASLPRPVIDHLWAHRRRPVSLDAMLAPPAGEAWRSVPTTLLLGRSDDLVPPLVQEWAAGYFEDVRVVEGDHLLVFRRPDLVAEVILEAMG